MHGAAEGASLEVIRPGVSHRALTAQLQLGMTLNLGIKCKIFRKMIF
jgi:hypothetical protein